MRNNDFCDSEDLKYTNGKSLNKIMTMFNDYTILYDKDKNVISSKEIIDLFLKKLHNKYGVIDLSNFDESTKNQFITNVIYSPYGLEKAYKHFKPQDLVDYINHGLFEYFAFCNKDAVDYLKPCIDKIDSHILVNSKFQNAIQEAAQDKTNNDEDIDLVIDF